MTLAAWYPKRSLGKRFTGLYVRRLPPLGSTT